MFLHTPVAFRRLLRELDPRIDEVLRLRNMHNAEVSSELKVLTVGELRLTPKARYADFRITNPRPRIRVQQRDDQCYGDDRVPTDFDLLDRWHAGDRTAGNALFQRYFASINRFFEHKLAADVDDLVQATFLALVRHAKQFRRQASFRTYLFSIARHEFYGYLRKQNGARAQLDFTITSLQELKTTPPSRLIRNERKQLLLEALRSLPLELQLLIELHYWEGIELKELALVFEITPSATRTRLFRARRTLRER
ncbi:MAG: RNA polymerase sigma factor, partial [Nannocystaceae bacterium]